jgi:hypothetical protein
LDPFRKHQRNHQPGMVFPPCHNQKESDTEWVNASSNQ